MSYTTTQSQPVAVHPARTGKWSFDPNQCSLLRYVSIVAGTMDDYRQLSPFHYRSERVGPVAGVWTLQQQIPLFYTSPRVVGVVVYTYPAPNVAARSIALGGQVSKATGSEKLRQLNGLIRTISRVVIDPQWRGLGLATWLVKTTMPKMNVPFIEALALMGRFHPFLERAGMRRIEPPENPKAAALRATLTALGIGEHLWHDADVVQDRIDALPAGHQAWVDVSMRRLLGAFGSRRKMPAGLDRTAFVLEKLCLRWSYFLWEKK